MLASAQPRSRFPTEDRQRQIAAAALRVIAQQGLGRFTTSAIAREVGISEGAIFRHFRSKDDIVGAALDFVEELLFGAELPAHSDPLTRLEAFFIERIRTLNAHPGIARVFFSDQLAQAGGDEVTAKARRLQERSTEFVRACLHEAAAKGLLRDGLAPEDLFVIAQGSALALTLLGIHTSEGDAAAERARRIFGVIDRLVRR